MQRGPLIWGLLFGAGFLYTSALAQENISDPKNDVKCGEHELGANLLSWINVDFDDAAQRSGDIHFANGLLYKFHMRQSALRFGVDVFRDSYVIGMSLGAGGDYPSDHLYRDGCIADGRIRLGYQRSFGKGRLKPFAGVDVGWRHAKERYDYENRGTGIIYNPNWGSMTITTDQLFIAPLFGINYRITEHWSFSIEAAFTWSKGHAENERTERSHMHPEERTYFYSSDRSALVLDPLRTVAVSYHF